MSLKKAEKLQDVLCIKGSSINAESQKTPAECRLNQFPRVLKPTFSRLFRTKNNICGRKRQEIAKLDFVYQRV